MEEFKFQTESFADIRILRYQVPNFKKLSLRQKTFAYHLSNAALAGRDIFWDQNYKHNLIVRDTLENVYKTFNGDRNTDCFQDFVVYLKRVWFSSGIHHHNSADKIIPNFNKECFHNLLTNSNLNNFNLITFKTLDELERFFNDCIFNPNIDSKKINQNENEDMILTSAVNFYDGVSQMEVDDFYSAKKQTNNSKISLGLNSKVIKENGIVKELIWKKNGLYNDSICNIINHLEKAKSFAENEKQKKAIELLIEFYETGDLEKFDEYNILWVSDSESEIDFINGFIETYDDPLGRKATWESTVQMIDYEANERVNLISNNAEWFEKNSPTDLEFKKEKIEGVTARAIDVVMESGATSPSTPIGINLPNADWIRNQYGSKSVTISNIINAYDQVSKNSGALEEFAIDNEEIRISKKWGILGSNLHVDMHEIIGHGSGKMAAGIGEMSETIKNHASTIEEARADLVALYFAMDEKLIDLGLMPNLEAGIAEYNSYIRGGLMTQLVRVELGKNLEEAHMRNRQLIAKWAFELGKNDNVIERISRDEKTFFKINNHQTLRKIFGIQLREIQRIKSTGDYDAAAALVEKYAINIDYDLHSEILERWKKLNIPPYSGFINPKLIAIESENKIVDVEIFYPDDFTEQMLEYSRISH
jgi:dipeptidyl-peptidase III